MPGDRPVMPYPSFVANEAWTNDAGVRSGMLYGRAGDQGVQWDPPVRYRAKNPVDDYNPNRFCGTADQWAGHMRTDRPEDIGDVHCCNPPQQPGVLMLDQSYMTDHRGISGSILLGDRSSHFGTPFDPGTSRVLLGDASTMTDYRPETPPCAGFEPATDLVGTIAGAGGGIDGDYPLAKLPGPIWFFGGTIGTDIAGGLTFRCSTPLSGWALDVSIPGGTSYGPGAGTNGPPLHIVFAGVDFTGAGGSATATVTVHP